MPAEWEPCDGVLMAWPHAASDWAAVLEDAQACVAQIATAISAVARVVIISSEPRETAAALAASGANLAAVQVVEQAVGDTWCRDYGPLTVFEGARPILIDAGFNGWGLKYPAADDNLASRRLYRAGVFGQTPLRSIGLILEGGSLESDGAGTLLSTARCLFEVNRNPHLSSAQICHAITDLLGAQRLLLLEHGHLLGDDTDAHIDTLVRWCPNHTMVYVACDDPADPHYEELAAMADELTQFNTLDGQPYRLLPLPWPAAQFAADGHRLPATYANYLVINQRVLAPTYNDPADQAALEVLASAFPDHEVIGIDCRVLIEQHGSLHCMTMQLPVGVLAPLAEDHHG